MVLTLASGLWRDHVLAGLALPAVSLAVWWPTIRAGRRERWIVIYVTGLYAYTLLRAAADDIGMPARVGYVLAFDRWLFGQVPSITLQRGLFSPREVGWLDVSTAAVHASFFVVPHAALLLIWHRRPQVLHTFVVAALATLYAGLLLFILVPTLPPWLAAADGHAPATYRVIDFVFRGMERGIYGDLQSALGEPNDIAAVPSIHMALTCVVLLQARAMRSRWVFPLTVYAAVMAFSLVYLGEHYVFDVLAGVAVAVAVELGVRRWWLPRRGMHSR